MTGALLLALALAQHPAPPGPPDSLHVVSAGSGPTVVLIPGIFGSVFGFRQVIPLLNAAGYRTVVIEPLGVGRSSRPAKADYSLTAQGELLARVIDTLGDGPVTVVAHSLGATIALRAAVSHPNLIAALISIEGGPTEEAATPAFRRAMKMAPLIRLLGGGFVRGRIGSMLKESSGDPSWITDAVIRGYTEDATADLGASLKAYQAMARAREPDSLATHLSAIRFPVTLLIGGARHDGGVDSAEVVLLSRRLPHFSVDSIPGVGHYIHEEQPRAILAAVKRMTPSPAMQRAGDMSRSTADANRSRR